MTGLQSTSYGTLVQANLAGQAAAKAALDGIGRGGCGPDVLYQSVRKVSAQWGDAGVEGFCRIVNKRLEAAIA